MKFTDENPKLTRWSLADWACYLFGNYIPDKPIELHDYATDRPGQGSDNVERANSVLGFARHEESQESENARFRGGSEANARHATDAA